MNRYEIKFDISDYKPEEIIKSYNLFQLHPKRKINEAIERIVNKEGLSMYTALNLFGGR